MQQTIMMIHGMWGNDWDWRYYKPFFESRGYRCVTPNLRYHDIDPKSDPPGQLGTTSVLDYAADLEKEIKQLDSLPILMGHSMGGLLAQILGRTCSVARPSYPCIIPRRSCFKALRHQELLERYNQVGILEKSHEADV